MNFVRLGILIRVLMLSFVLAGHVGAQTQSQGASEAEVNLLFVEAVVLYREAMSGDPAEQIQKLAQVKSMFDQILSKAPNSTQALSIAAGGVVAGVDTALLNRNTSRTQVQVDQPEQTSSQPVGMVLDASDVTGMLDFVVQTFPTTKDVLHVDTVISFARDKAYLRGTYFLAILASHFDEKAASRLGNLFTPEEFRTAIEKYISGGSSAAGLNVATDTAADVAESLAVEFAASVTTDVLMTAKPKFVSSKLEVLIRAGIKAAIIETYDAIRIAMHPDPWSIGGKIFQRFHDIIKIAHATNALSKTQDIALLQFAIGMDTAAYLVVAYPSVRSEKIVADNLRLMHVTMPDIVGTDDATQVARIYNLGFAALRSAYSGDLQQAQTITTQIRQVAKVSNIGPFALFTKPHDWLVAAANWGKDAPQRAGEILVGATPLSDFSKLTPLPSKSPSASSWAVSTSPDSVLRPGQSGDGFVAANDGSMEFSGETIFAPRIDVEFHIHQSPDGSYAMIFQRDLDWGGIRAALVDVSNKRIVNAGIIGEQQVRGVGQAENVLQVGAPVAWEKAGEFAFFAISPADWESELAIIRTGTGNVSRVAPRNLSNGEWPVLDLSLVTDAGDGRHDVDFEIFSCKDSGCTEPKSLRQETVSVFPEDILSNANKTMPGVSRNNLLDASSANNALSKGAAIDPLMPGGNSKLDAGGQVTSNGPWKVQNTPDFNLKAGQNREGFSFSDAGTFAFNQSTLFGGFAAQAADFAVFKSPRTSQAIAMVRVDGALRMALVDLDQNAVLNDSYRAFWRYGAAGVAVWEPGGRYVALPLPMAEFSTGLGVFELATGKYIVVPDRTFDPNANDTLDYNSLITIQNGGMRGLVKTLELDKNGIPLGFNDNLNQVRDFDLFAIFSGVKTPFIQNSQDPAQPSSTWTEAILHPGGYGRPTLTSCIYSSIKTDVECLRADGATAETLRFVQARKTIGGEGPVVPVDFMELGVVDIAFLDIFSMSQNEIEYFVNTVPESITYPQYPERDLNLIAKNGNADARAILQSYPKASDWKPFIGGMRLLPNGDQRFSAIVYWTEFCRACKIVGLSVASIDYGPDGRLKSFQNRGLLDNRRHGSLPLSSASGLRSDTKLVQYALNVRGYDAGQMDGAIGPKTRAALAAFQRENGVNAGTGALDDATLAALVDRATLFANGTDPNKKINPPHLAAAGENWLQVASRDTLFAAKQIANQIAPLNPEVAIFQANNGWFAVVAGSVTIAPVPDIKTLIAQRGLPTDSFLTDGSIYQTNIGYKPPLIAPEHACSRPEASVGKSEILSLFENQTVDTREGAGRYVARSYGDYDRQGDNGTYSSTTNYNGQWQTFDQIYRVSNGQICGRFVDRSTWNCEFVKRCDPDGKGAGSRLVLLTKDDQISVTIDFLKPETKPAPSTAAAVTDGLSVKALTDKLINASKLSNSSAEKALLGELIAVSGSDFRRLSDLEKLSRLTGILAKFEVRAGVPPGSFKIVDKARNNRMGAHPRRGGVLTDGAWKKNPNKDFHTIGIAEPNRVEKYSKADGSEAIFYNDPQTGWRILADGVNDATFNYVPEGKLFSTQFANNAFQHMVMDVIPWMIWGASPNDTTSISERLAAFERSGTYRNLVQVAVTIASGKLPDKNPVTTNSSSGTVDVVTASAPQLAALLLGFGVKEQNVTFASGDISAQTAAANTLVTEFKSNPPIVITPDLPVSGWFDPSKGTFSACIPREVYFPNNLVLGTTGYGNTRAAAGFVIAPANPLTSLGALPALCFIDMSAINKVEAQHGQGELEKFGLNRPRGLALSFKMTSQQGAVFTQAAKAGTARVRIECEMKTMIQQPFVSIPYPYEKIGTCVPKDVLLKTTDVSDSGIKQMSFSAGGKVFSPKSDIVTITAPKAITVVKPKAKNQARAQWTFETSGSGEPAIRAIMDGLEGTTAEIFLHYDNAYPFQTDPEKKLAVAVFGNLPEDQVATQAGTEMGYGSFVLKSWSNLNNYYFEDQTNPGRASAVIGQIESLRVLSVRELAANVCEWSVTYRAWLKNTTPFGDALMKTSKKDGLTFEICFRTTRTGFEVSRFKYLDL